MTLGQFGQVNGALAGPGDVGQQREDPGEVEAVRLDQTMGEQVQLEVGLGGADRRSIFGEEGGNQRPMAFCQAGQQLGLAGIEALDAFSQFAGLLGGEGDGLIAAVVAEFFGNFVAQLASWVEQRLSVEHFKPGVLTVLCANAEGQAEQRGGHGVFLTTNSNELVVAQTTSVA